MSATFEGQNPLVRAPTQNAFKQSGRVLSLTRAQRWYSQEYLKSEHWRLLRLAKFKESPTCQRCGSFKHINVHHRTYERLGAELLSDLEVLCRNCHSLEHSKISAIQKAKVQAEVIEIAKRRRLIERKIRNLGHVHRVATAVTLTKRRRRRDKKLKNKPSFIKYAQFCLRAVRQGFARENEVMFLRRYKDAISRLSF